MKRKRLLLILGCLGLVLLAGYVTLRLTAPPGHRITWDNICAIKKGMTQADIKAILGVPPGVYSSTPTGYYFFSNYNRGSPPTGLELIKTFGGKEWVGDGVSAYVLFDENGRAVEIHGGLVLDGDESFLDKIRHWLGM
jgi:outer membrane protein assembly factor BamE (lipoprotein component of BamABCDE complex)